MIDIKNRLKKIQSIWINYILSFDILHKEVNYDFDLNANEIGAILAYFIDTLPIIEKEYKSAKNFPEHFADCVSFLQTIYIQQDFIEELLIVFKTKVGKGDLKQDETYIINRDIRNELVGHPLRKDIGKKDQQNEEINGKANNKLISMSLFSLIPSSFDTISYLKYHASNNFNFQHEQHSFEDVMNRHVLFLEKYLNQILHRISVILERFIKHLDKFKKNLLKMPMTGLVKVLSNSYSSIYQHDHLYTEENLLKLDQNKDNNKRYKLVLEKFYNDLSDMIIEHKINSYRYLNKDKEIDNLLSQLTPEPFLDNHYEIGKLFSLEDKTLFDMYSSNFSSLENQEILDELKYAKENFDDKFEYYCALHHIEILAVVGL